MIDSNPPVKLHDSHVINLPFAAICKCKATFSDAKLFPGNTGKKNENYPVTNNEQAQKNLSVLQSLTVTSFSKNTCYNRPKPYCDPRF